MKKVDEMKLCNEIKRKDVCFCPYCRVVSKNPQVFKDRLNIGYQYKCFDCNKDFNPDTYIEQARNGKNYHCVKCDVNKIIHDIIFSFYDIGCSQRKIHELTHFSRSKIQEVTSAVKKEKRMTKDVFFTDHLNIDEDTTLRDAINTALDYGCSKREVRELFNTSYKKMDRLGANRNRGTNYSHHRIKIDGDEIIYYFYK